MWSSLKLAFKVRPQILPSVFSNQGLREQNKLLRLENELLRQQLRAAKDDLELLRLNMAEFSQFAAEGFVREAGALFKARPSGGYYNLVFCPQCRASVSPSGLYAEFICRCGWRAVFTREQLPDILGLLPTRTETEETDPGIGL